MLHIPAVLRGAGRANSLIIEESPFTDNELQQVTGAQLKLNKLQLSERLGDNNPSIHRFYNSSPLKLINPGNFTGRPTNSETNYTAFLNNIYPQFSLVSDEFFLEKFRTLDTAIVDAINNMDPSTLIEYRSAIKLSLSTRLNLMSDDLPSEADAMFCFQVNVASPCTDILEFLIPSLKSSMGAHVVEHNVFTPDITFKSDEKTLLVVELKRPTLTAFINDDGTLKQDDPLFNSILKKFCSYLFRCDLPYGLLSDFNTTIFIQPNSHHYTPVVQTDKLTDRPEPPYIDLRIGYRIIKNTDTRITVPAIVAALIYDRFISMQQNTEEGILVELNDGLGSKALLKDPEARSLHDALMKDSATIRAIQKAQRRLETIPEMIEEYKFNEVNKEKLQKIINIELNSEDVLQPIRVGSKYLSQVFKMSFDKYSGFFNLDNVPPGVVMKLYNFSDLEANLKLNRDWWHDCFFKGFNEDDMYEVVIKSFLTEVSCYIRIQNSNKHIRTPRLYDYGFLSATVEGKIRYSGLYMLMTYIETTEQDEKMTEYLKSFDSYGRSNLFDLVDKALPNDSHLKEDLVYQSQLLEDIGVYHNDWKLSNVKLNNGKFTTFDFSHAKLGDR